MRTCLKFEMFCHKAYVFDMKKLGFVFLLPVIIPMFALFQVTRAFYELHTVDSDVF